MPDNLSNQRDQYLSFNLSDDVYALDIGSIKEVLDNRNITKLPQTPEFMRGVINLRGQVVPIIDLNIKFGMPQTQFTVDTCIIIVEIELEDGSNALLGALTDAVHEVVELGVDDIDPPPKLGMSVDCAFIYGMGKYNDEFIIILDVKRLFTIAELTVVADASHDTAENLELR